jgi:hypothetical protein
MSKLAVIREILHENFKHSNQNCLSEEDTDSKGKKFKVNYKIVKQPRIDFELFRFDEAALPFFKDITDLKKMCDYILFAEEGKYLYIFVIELKLGNLSAKKQLNAAKEFVQFIINSANRIGKEFDTNYKIRKIRICDNRIKKRKLKGDKIIQFDDNDYCEYPLGNLYLEHLMQY